MSRARRVAVLASGRGTDLQSLLDAAHDGRITSRIVLVLSDKTDAKALERARKAGIASAAISPSDELKGDAKRKEHEARLIKEIDAHGAELVVLAGYMRILTPLFVRHYKGRLINVHPALLPAFPGAHGQQQALEWGARISGCTTHFVDEEVDHGPIILQAAVAVEPDDTADSLSRRILAAEHQILPRTVHLWETGALTIKGRRVIISAKDSWTKTHPTIPGVLYGPGY
jgi:phosphoribosylglycinamide formyltransferase 1